ncbi:MAG: NTP transferase domain-containing protein [Planctomycetes bacterium]|nr:NTP transferase domain-containing protein [Planctomycetota bacterium]
MQTRNLIKTKLKDIDVLILCGGFGSRLAQIVNDRPKPMAKVNHQPFLDIIIDYFARFGLRRFVLCTGYMSEIIQEYYDQKSSTLEFVVSNEPIPLGTAGCIKNAQKFLQSDHYLVANGDSFCPVNLYDFYNFHLSRQSLMTIAVTESEDTKSCGLVKLDNSQKIVSFEEKKSNCTTGYINTGIYLFHKNALSLIPECTKYSLEYNLFPRLIKHDSFAFVSSEELIDIGTPERYKWAKEYFASSQRNLVYSRF